jgi:hypothetical protein
MSWNAELAFLVTPKSGPLRPMRTLVDAARTLVDDLPQTYRRRSYWISVRQFVLRAAGTGSALDIRLATDALVCALELEGWMTRAPVVPGTTRRSETAFSPAERIEPGWLHAAE